MHSRLFNLFAMACLLGFFHSVHLHAQEVSADRVIELPSGTSASFRGIDVVSEHEVWISGSDGTVLRSLDAGQTVTRIAVPDAAELDFRDIEVLPDGSIILMSIGNGESSKLLRSIDEGKSWTVVLQNHDADAFFDGIAVHSDGKRAALFGDPIDGTMDLYLTENAGASWQRVAEKRRPQLEPGEFGFAASGTGIHWGSRGLQIATGGSVARIHRTTNQGRSWSVLPTPLLAQRPSAGVFSMAVDESRIVLVGGDYLKPNETGFNVAVSADFGRSFQLPAGNPIGHKACVRILNETTIVCCGRTGVELSTDFGSTWKHLTDTAYYTMDADIGSGTVILAGPEGRIGRLVLSN